MSNWITKWKLFLVTLGIVSCSTMLPSLLVMQFCLIHFNLCSIDGCNSLHCGCYQGQWAIFGANKRPEWSTLKWGLCQSSIPYFDYPGEELCSLLNLANVTTGKGLLELAKANARPLEDFVAEKYNTKEYLRGF